MQTRRTLYIPSDLKAQMDHVDRTVAPPVNWSAIAQRAFAAEVKRLTKKRGRK